MTTTPPPAWPASLPPMPVVDFAQFGAVESVPLSRHQKMAASFLARNWAQIPHVTHHDEAEIDAAEALRQKQKTSLVPLIIQFQRYPVLPGRGSREPGDIKARFGRVERQGEALAGPAVRQGRSIGKDFDRRREVEV